MALRDIQSMLHNVHKERLGKEGSRIEVEVVLKLQCSEEGNRSISDLPLQGVILEDIVLEDSPGRGILKQ